MAKQNVSFGERHLEKIVVGVAGAVLAAMLFLYVIQDPYSVRVGGETFGPNAFYPRLDEQATQMLQALRNASPREVEPPELPVITGQRTSTDLPIVFAQIHPPVPLPDSRIDPGGRVDLVGILPPGKPVATSGKATAEIPPPQIVKIGEGQRPGSTTVASQLEDVTWAAVFATIPRGDQNEAFRKAKYAVDLQKLVVSDVEVERQQLLPDGTWGPPEQVERRFKVYDLQGPTELAPQRDPQTGETFFRSEDYLLVKSFLEEALKYQPDILRPPFQSVLPPESQLEWTVPPAMPDGVKIDWVQDYEIAIPAPADAAPGGPTGPVAPRVPFGKIKAEIDELINQGQFIQAEEKARESLSANPNLPPNQKEELETLIAQLEPRARQQAEQQEEERARRLRMQEATLGPDTDVLWLTDLSVVPGQTYRYRVRLLALNLHAGQLRKLRTVEDAAKVVLAGEWSKWSEPVAIAPVKRVFLTAVNSEENLRIELYQWKNGEWDKINPTISLGQPMTFKEQLKEFSYDAVPALLDESAQWQERTVSRQDSIRYDVRSTKSVAFIRDAGQIEERFLAEDVRKRREMAAELSTPKGATPRRAITPQRRPAIGRPGPRGPTRGRRFEDDF